MVRWMLMVVLLAQLRLLVRVVVFLLMLQRFRAVVVILRVVVLLWLVQAAVMVAVVVVLRFGRKIRRFFCILTSILLEVLVGGLVVERVLLSCMILTTIFFIR